jgi:ribonuclease R
MYNMSIMTNTTVTHIEGRIALSNRGLGFVRSQDFDDAIVIEPQDLDLALSGDIVKVLILPKIENKDQSGKIVEIVKRKKKGFSGSIVEKDGNFYLKPQDFRDKIEILIPKEDLSGAKVGEKVFGVITKWTKRSDNPIGKVVEVLGVEGENNAEMKAIALEKGFAQDFPAQVLKEAQTIASRGILEEDSEGRKDMRGITTFTIDPADAKDFDDALSIETIGDGKYRIGIHIADVSFYVKPGTELDKEAFERATSVYLVDRTIPMLPEELSNDLCSLKPEVDRLAFSTIFDIDSEGVVSNTWFGRTVIYSDKRFSYEDAQTVLDNKSGDYYDELQVMVDISKKLTKIRFQNGAISLESDEVKFKLNEEGVPVSVYTKERGDTHRMIEEFMLLANQHVAKYLSADEEKNERLAIYRIHDTPALDRTEDLVRFLDILGFKVKTKDGVIPSKEINKISKEAEEDDMGATIQTAIIRSMAKAIYSIKNLGHYGLAFEYYTHFTSPIRRYPDVLVHRLLQTYLDGESIPKGEWPSYQSMCDHSSEREKDASNAERDSIKYKQVEYMTSHVGEEFNGVITGVTEMGLFVAELTTRSEGLIRIRDIGQEFFRYDEKKMAIIGSKSKVTYRLGDHVKIKVKNADLEKKLIDYTFIGK